MAVLGFIAIWNGTSLASHDAEGGSAGIADTYLMVVNVREDESGHHEFIQMPSSLSVEVILEGPVIVLHASFPWVDVSGEFSDGEFSATGSGTVAGFDNVSVIFQGIVTADGPVGNYWMGTDGGLPGGIYINYELKPPEKRYTITVLKQHGDSKAGLPGWEMNIFDGSGCNGSSFDSAVTDEDGIAEFGGLAAGAYSVEEKMQPGWNNVTPLCQDTTVPGGAGSAGVPACPIDPDLPPPAAGCDEFNSAASVKVQFTNPPSDPLDCDLSGPTLITRSAVVEDTLDYIETEIVAMNLTGMCGGAADVTIRESSALASTGRITEQQNSVPGELEFKANSYFDIFFEVDTPIGTLHNQDPLHLECKIQGIPPYGCVYEPDVGNLILYNADKKEVAKLLHAAHIPLDPKKTLLIFENVPKLTPPPPTLNPDFEEKIDVCIDAQVIANPGATAIWTKAQIDTLVDGAGELWAQANINITWNNDITDIDDPDPPPPGQVGDIIDTFKDDTEFLALGTNNPNSTGKEKCVRVFFIRHFIDNDGTQYETVDGDTTLAEVDDKGRGHYVVVGLKSKDNSQTFAHELGHIFGLQHDDDKADNLMSSFKEPENTQLNKDQMRAAREGAAEISAQPTATPTATPQPGATNTPTPTHTQTAPTNTPTATEEPGGDGDANKDGTVDSRDALLILQSVVGLIDPPPNSDVNQDGAVNALDSLLVLQRVVGLLLSLPI